MTQMRALITGAGGLVGSACAERLCDEGWEVAGVDNDMRQQFFGPAGSTAQTITRLLLYSRFRHVDLDVRNREGVRRQMEMFRPDFVIHAAAQPSHDRAAAIPYDDFDVNAVGTLNVLQAMRDFCPESPLCFCSTNKVYGDRPNALPLREDETRYDYADGRDGIDETMPIDGCLHSLFGASKVAADVLCQEYGRYFGMPVGIFRGGCLTGPRHASVALHGFLSYIARCAVQGEPYVIHGYQGKQVRDQIHADDVAALFLEFFRAPRRGEVYNLGGGRTNSASILEVEAMLASSGFPLQRTYDPEPRVGDHICYVTDLSKLRRDFPGWQIEHTLPQILDEIREEEAACVRS